MIRIPLPLTVILLAGFSTALSAQTTKPKSSPGEERFKPYRLEAKPTPEQRAKITAMRNGNVNLEPVSKADQDTLDEMARVFVYPVTHYEYYFAPENPNSELVPRTASGPSLSTLLGELRNQMIIANPRSQLPPTQQSYIKEFGASIVKAVNEVLAKSPPPVIRINALRILELAAESGVPAAWDKTLELLKMKDDKACPMEVLYYALRSAEKATGAYDKDLRWIDKDKYFELVTILDEMVLKMPACIAEKTHQPEKPATTVLATNSKPAPATPPKPDASTYTREQEDAIRFYRIHVIRALAHLKTDIVKNNAGDKERRPLYTLVLVTIGDASVVPAPSFKEVGEAVIGLGTMLPSDTTNATGLGAAIAIGVFKFAQQKQSDSVVLDKEATSLTHWKVYGARMKSTFAAWEKDLQSPKVKLAKADKDLLVGLSQLCTTDVFDPLTKQGDGATQVNRSQIENWYNTKVGNPTAPIPLYTDNSKYSLRVGTGR